VTFQLLAWCPPENKEGKLKEKIAIIGQHTCYTVYQINPAFCDAVYVLLSTKKLICVSFQYSCIYMISRGKIHILHRYYSIYKMMIRTAEGIYN
jgi:hypothetical protein